MNRHDSQREQGPKYVACILPGIARSDDVGDGFEDHPSLVNSSARYPPTLERELFNPFEGICFVKRRRGIVTKTNPIASATPFEPNSAPSTNELSRHKNKAAAVRPQPARTRDKRTPRHRSQANHRNIPHPLLHLPRPPHKTHPPTCQSDCGERRRRHRDARRPPVLALALLGGPIAV